ncbi:N-alpha-acetyltransferase 15, NatA auxiliary subunit [Blyttiomyces sp. JEL0837]|nr:N-alpha-acetyltransferase 15, NatA auxiliary subunit [Blyttiomyces sp. JEL0837]
MAAGAKKVDLPSKESALLKAALKFHENKLYKKGMKTCDQILKKFPDHGETVAMKALFLSNLDRKDEAHEHIKRALRLEITNPVCWHVYGLIHRTDKNYEEAIKCYTQATKFDKENVQLYRDQSMLHIQTRNLDGLIDSNIALILVRPGTKPYWLSLAVSFHLLNRYDEALECIGYFYDMFQSYVQPNVEYENSEVYLYKAMILEECGKWEEALEFLDKVEKSVLDKKAWKEARARLLLQGGKSKQAESAYKLLMRANPDCYGYIEGLMKCRNLYENLDEERTNQLFELFEDLVTEYNRSNAVKRIPLNYASGSRFRVRVDNYMRPMIRKGVPSLFNSLKSLYTDPTKLETIQDLVLGYESALKSHSRFYVPAADASEEELDDIEPPTALLWVLYFLAQHFDYVRDGKKAMEYIDEAIKHTPTMVELLMTKARILKHAGGPEEAMNVMDQARKRDLQDRFINTKCSKYMLRNDKIELAESTVVLFCRNDSNDKLGDLVEMQAIWWGFESAMANIRIGKFGRALKRFHQIEKHFFDFYDDQFDFHNYSLRKSTVRAYVNLIRMEDRLRSHPLFFKSAVEAVRLYIRLFDKPFDEERERDALGLGEMSEADKRKAARKARKAELKGDGEGSGAAAVAPGSGAAANAVSKDVAAKSGGGDAGNKKKVDEDPEGLKLLNSSVLLVDCMKFLKPLLELSPGQIASQVLGAAVYLRKKMYMMAWKCLKKGYKIDPEDPQLHQSAVRFWMEVHSEKTTLNPTVKSIIMSELETVYGKHKDMISFSEDFTKRNAGSLPHVLASSEVLAWLDRPRRKDLVKKVSGAVLSGKGVWKSVTLETVTAAYKSISSVILLGNPDAAGLAEEKAAFAVKCREAFPLATVFKA